MNGASPLINIYYPMHSLTDMSSFSLTRISKGEVDLVLQEMIPLLHMPSFHIRMLVQLLVTPLLIQFPASTTWEAEEMPQVHGPLLFTQEIWMEFWDTILPFPNPSYCESLGSDPEDTKLSLYIVYIFLITYSEFGSNSNYTDVNANDSGVTYSQ